MPTQCKPLSFAFQGCQGRRVAAAFDGGAITSNAGVLLLREIDRSIGILDRVADCFSSSSDVGSHADQGHDDRFPLRTHEIPLPLDSHSMRSSCRASLALRAASPE